MRHECRIDTSVAQNRSVHSPTAVAPPAATTTSRRPVIRLNRAGMVVLIGSFTLLPAVASDMYLPSLPEVATDLSTSAAGAQFTITGMVLGGAVGTLMVGPISDRYGRRRPALVGISGHVVASLLCMVAPTIGVLIGLRLLQGFMAAAATVSAIAVVRDLYNGAEVAHFMSRIMLVIGAAPLLAPSLGAVIATHGGWRAVFGWLALLGAVVLAFAALALPETLPPERRRHRGAGSLFGGYAAVLRDGRFRALAVLPGITQAVVISYVAASPFVFREEFGLSAQQFSLIFATGGICLVASAQVNAAVVRRVGPARLLRLGLPALALGGAAMVVVSVTGIGGVAALLAAMWFTFLAIGFVPPNASAIALSRHGDRAGTAGATIGTFQSAVAGSVSSLVGLLGGGAIAMSGVILGTAVTGVLILAVFTPAYRREGWVALGSDGSAEAPAAVGTL